MAYYFKTSTNIFSDCETQLVSKYSWDYPSIWHEKWWICRWTFRKLEPVPGKVDGIDILIKSRNQNMEFEDG